MRGQQVRVASDGKIEIAGSVGDPGEPQSFVRTGDWNEFEIIANRPSLLHKTTVTPGSRPSLSQSK